MRKLARGFIQHHKAGAGFTLIELLVVISIIGILTTLVAANLNAARVRARDAERKSDLKNISTALRLYFNDNGSFPDNSAIPWGQSWTANNGNTVYMNMVPQDPLAPTQIYTYQPGATKDTFTLTSCLENSSDKQGSSTQGSGITCSSGWMYQVKQQ